MRHFIKCGRGDEMFGKPFSIMIMIMVFLIIVVVPSSAQGSRMTYYVAKNGNDANPGTLESPWLTIQHAAETVKAGDTVYIRGGIYNENVHIPTSGNPGAYIVFSAYPKERPIIDGKGVTDTQNGIIIDTSYLKLIGLEIRNWEETGILGENAAWIEISDCEVHDVVYGIGFGRGSHDFTLNRVVMHHFDLFGFDTSPAGGPDCYNVVLNDCVAHTGRDPEQNVDGFAIGHGNQHNFVFNNCTAYDVFDGFDIGAGARNITLNRSSAHDCFNGGYKLWGDNIRLENCLAYNNDVSNVELDWDGTAGTSTLQNCNFVHSGTYNIWVENSADSLHMYNSIVAGGENSGLTFEQRDVRNYRGDYNIFHNSNPNRMVNIGYEDEFSLEQVRAGEWAASSGQDTHSLAVDSLQQLFVNPSSYDFRLLENSPAVNAGSDTDAPKVDYNGYSRQGKVDIGAFEKGSFPSTTTMTPSLTNGGSIVVATEGVTDASPTEATLQVNLVAVALVVAGVLILRKKGK